MSKIELRLLRFRSKDATYEEMGIIHDDLILGTYRITPSGETDVPYAVHVIPEVVEDKDLDEGVAVFKPSFENDGETTIIHPIVYVKNVDDVIWKG